MIYFLGLLTPSFIVASGVLIGHYRRRNEAEEERAPGRLVLALTGLVLAAQFTPLLAKLRAGVDKIRLASPEVREATFYLGLGLWFVLLFAFGVFVSHYTRRDGSWLTLQSILAMMAAIPASLFYTLNWNCWSTGACIPP